MNKKIYINFNKNFILNTGRFFTRKDREELVYKFKLISNLTRLKRESEEKKREYELKIYRKNINNLLKSIKKKQELI